MKKETKEEIKKRKLVKYLKGTAKCLVVLAKEIEKEKTLSKESEELISKIGSHLLFIAKTYSFLI